MRTVWKQDISLTTTTDAGTTSQDSLGRPPGGSTPTTRHSSVSSQRRGFLGSISSLGLFTHGSANKSSVRSASRQGSSRRGFDAEKGGQNVGGGSVAAAERSVVMGGSSKAISSPFDTPSTNTPLTTKGSQNTSVATEPVTGDPTQSFSSGHQSEHT